MTEDDGARWRVLAAFSFHAFCNQFCYMNFAEAYEVTESAFSVSDYGVNWLYSASMASAVPSFILVMAFSKANPWSTSLIGVSCTVVAGWLRLVAMSQRDFRVAIVSSVFLGPGTAVICTGFADLPLQLFPPGWKRKVVVGVAVQSTFFGWAVGGLLASLLIRSISTMQNLIMVQAICVSLALPVFLVVHRQPLEPPSSDSSEIAMLGREVTVGYGTEGGEAGLASQTPAAPPLSMPQSFASMLCNWRFLLQALACALLQAVGYALPAVQESVFASKGYTPLECATSGFVFILSGVVLGIILSSPLGPAGKAPKLVMAFFWIGTIAMMLLQESVSSLSDQLANLSGSHEGEQIIILCLMVLGGGCSLGFLNITLPLVCADAHPVDEVYSGGMIELLAFGLGAVLTQESTGVQFVVCAGASFGATLFMTMAMMLTPSVEPEPGALPRSSSSSGVTMVPVAVPMPVPVPFPVAVPVLVPGTGAAIPTPQSNPGQTSDMAIS